MTVVDASVILSMLLEGEPHHVACKLWFTTLVEAGERFSAPTILLSEVAAPLGRAYEKPELAQKIIDLLTAAPFANLVPVSTPLAQSAATIAANHKIRGCDAIYVALAKSLNEPLLTLDMQQMERGTAVITIQHP